MGREFDTIRFVIKQGINGTKGGSQGRSFFLNSFTLVGLLAGLSTAHASPSEWLHKLVGPKKLTKAEVSQLLGKRSMPKGYMETSEIVIPQPDTELMVEYTVLPEVEKEVLELFTKGKVRHGAFVAIDPATGQILGMVSYSQPRIGDVAPQENLAIRATFPSASVFKVVTAATVIENKKVQYDSLIPVRGSYHTLYKQNVFNAGGIEASNLPLPVRRYSKRAPRPFQKLISLGEAFGQSVNSVFGKLGIFGAGPQPLRDMAQRFLFNREVPFELDVSPSSAVIPDDAFGLAESASGYTRLNNMSPLHGALISAAIANDGVLMEPSIVSGIYDKKGKIEYRNEAKTMGQVISTQTAQQLQYLMGRTISSGTSRRSFSGYQRHMVLSQLLMGGKTGTLDGMSPPGRYDWFVGFAMKGDRKIAVATLCIHGNRKGIKSSFISRKVFEHYFKPDLALHRPVLSPNRTASPAQ